MESQVKSPIPCDVEKLDTAVARRLDGDAEMDKLRIRMIGKEDRNGNEFFMTTTNIPVLVDLSSAVIHVFPDENADGKEFWAELVIRKYDPRHSQKDVPPRRRKRRRKPGTNGGQSTSTTSDG